MCDNNDSVYIRCFICVILYIVTYQPFSDADYEEVDAYITEQCAQLETVVGQWQKEGKVNDDKFRKDVAVIQFVKECHSNE